MNQNAIITKYGLTNELFFLETQFTGKLISSRLCILMTMRTPLASVINALKGCHRLWKYQLKICSTQKTMLIGKNQIHIPNLITTVFP